MILKGSNLDCSQGVIFTLPLTAATRTGFYEDFTPKLNDIIIEENFVDDEGEDSFYWHAYEFETSAKSMERVYHMLMKADYLIATRIVQKVTWLTNVDSTYDLISKSMGQTIPKFHKNRFGKYQPHGDGYQLSDKHNLTRLYEQATRAFKEKTNTISTSLITEMRFKLV